MHAKQPRKYVNAKDWTNPWCISVSFDLFSLSVNWIDDQRESMVGYKSSTSNVWWKVFKKRAGQPAQPSPDKANKTITVYVTQTAQFMFFFSQQTSKQKGGGETTYYARWSRQDKDSPRDSTNVSRKPEQHCCQHKQPTKNCDKKEKYNNRRGVQGCSRTGQA